MNKKVKLGLALVILAITAAIGAGLITGWSAKSKVESQQNSQELWGWKKKVFQNEEIRAEVDKSWNVLVTTKGHPERMGQPVLEWFSYTCSHCQEFQKLVKSTSWEAKNSQINLIKVHSLLRSSWTESAALHQAWIALDPKRAQERYEAWIEWVASEVSSMKEPPTQEVWNAKVNDRIQTMLTDEEWKKWNDLKNGNAQIMEATRSLERHLEIPGTPVFIWKKGSEYWLLNSHEVELPSEFKTHYEGLLQQLEARVPKPKLPLMMQSIPN